MQITKAQYQEMQNLGPDQKFVDIVLRVQEPLIAKYEQQLKQAKGQVALSIQLVNKCLNEMITQLVSTMRQATTLQQVNTIRNYVGTFFIYIQSLTGNDQFKTNNKLTNPAVFGLMDTLQRQTYGISIV